MNVFERGDTFQITWVDCSITAVDDSLYEMIDGSETVVNTGSLASSGNGRFYADFTIPSSWVKGYYVSRTTVTVGGLPYTRSERFKVTVIEVD